VTILDGFDSFSSVFFRWRRAAGVATIHLLNEQPDGSSRTINVTNSIESNGKDHDDQVTGRNGTEREGIAPAAGQPAGHRR